MTQSAGEKRRQEIQLAVLRVIDQEGVSAVTHRRVGKEAGLSSGLVSYHFPTRDDLIFKSFAFYLGSIDDYSTNIGWNDETRISRGNTKALLIDIGTRIVQQELSHKKNGRLDVELSLYGARNQEIAALVNNWTQGGVASIARVLKQSGVTNAVDVSAGLVQLIQGFLLECLTNPDLTATDFRCRLEVLIRSFDD